MLPVIAAMALGVLQTAGMADERFDPRDIRSELALARTQVMVLGTPHLSGAPENFDAAWLAPVLCRLTDWEPEVIAQEDVSGAQVRFLDNNKAVYGNLAQQYGGRALAIAAVARETLDLTPGEAHAAALDLSAKEGLSSADRRHLAVLFAAAGEPASAVVNLWALPPAERTAGADMPSDLLAALLSYAERQNESLMIGARLAADLGLTRVYGMADHMSDIAQPGWDAFVAAAERDQAVVDALNFATPELAPLTRQAQRLDDPAMVMPVYRQANAARTGILDAGAQWGSLLKSEMAGAPGRARVAAWEAQNLKMVAAIREASAGHAGGRVLVLVGSSHKPYLEAYLDMLSDVQIVSSSALLASEPPACGAAD